MKTVQAANKKFAAKKTAPVKTKKVSMARKKGM